MRIAVVGKRAERLSSIMDGSGLDFVVYPDTLLDVDLTNLNPHAVLASVEGGYGTLIPFINSAQRLRTDQLYWGSIYLIAPDSVLTEDPELERKLIIERWGVHLHDPHWKIYFDRLPPDDVEALANDIAASEPLEPERRRRIYFDSLQELAVKIGGLADQITPGRLVTAETLRKSMIRVCEVVSGESQKNSQFSQLSTKLTRLLEQPGFLESDISALRSTIAEAERRVIETDQILYAALHNLKNDLTLPWSNKENPGRISEEIAAKITSVFRCDMCQDVNFAKSLMQLQELLRSTGKLEESRQGLSEVLGNLHRWLASNDSSHAFSTDLSVARIVIAEDHPGWRDRILAAVKSLVTGLPIEEAGDIAAAEALLRQDKPALAIVDLGLPLRKGGLPVPTAGISLVQKFITPRQGTAPQHRFLILTAVEDYAPAVQQALMLGIAPSSYLQKTPTVCDTELPAQVRIALQPAPEKLPLVEVFFRTARVARVEGTETVLEYPAWCLLAILADCPRRFVQTERLATALSREPYHLDPKSRDPKLKGADPAVIICEQIPYYISELRMALDLTYRRACNQPPPLDFVESDEDCGYRLNANAIVLQTGSRRDVARSPLVLVVEDNDTWRDHITNGLEARGFQTLAARYTEEACTLLLERAPDLVSLDIELPGTEAEYRKGETNVSNCLKFFEFMKRNAPDVPISVLTSTAWCDHIMMPMLRGGIRLEDYLHKSSKDPIVRLAASLARLWQEVLRRSRILDWNVTMPLHPLVIRSDERMLEQIGSHRIALASEHERKILHVLSETPNEFVSRLELIEAAYGSERPSNPDSALNNHMNRLRSSIEKQTGIPGEEVIGSDRGAYVLRGIPQ